MLKRSSIILFLGCLSLFAQSFWIGEVWDGDLNEPLPYANISYPGTGIYTSSNYEGKFKLPVKPEYDTIKFSFVGYKTVKLYTKDLNNPIQVTLIPDFEELDAFVVEDGEEENPAHRIFRAILANKDKYNLDKLPGYEYDVYNKIEFDINKLTDKFKESKLMKPMQFIFDYTDSTNGVEYLPVFLTETASKVYRRREGNRYKEFIKANRISGIDNDNIKQFFGDLYQNFNIYENFVPIYDKNFHSPLGNTGLQHYRYFITDSAYIDGHKNYELTFIPKWKQELTFNGTFWVRDSLYYITEIEGSVNNQANINYVNTVQFRKKFVPYDDSLWVQSEESLLIDFAVTKKTMGLFGRKTAYYSHYNLDPEVVKPAVFFDGDRIETLEVDEDTVNWQGLRRDSLTAQEKNIYLMVDSLKKVPAFKSYTDIVELLVTGYIDWGKIAIGPISTFYGNNIVEGNRIGLGFKTNHHFSERIQMRLYGAYGFKDQRWKYQLDLKLMGSRKRWEYLELLIKDDVERYGQPAHMYSNGIVPLLFSRTRIRELINMQSLNLNYHTDIAQQLSLKVGFHYESQTPLGDVHWNADDEAYGIAVTNLSRAFVRTTLTWTPTARWFKDYFKRSLLYADAPQVRLTYDYGIPIAGWSPYEYHQLKLGLQHNFLFLSLGKTTYRLEAGKTWGALPFPFLFMAPGNETYGIQDIAYNNMNYVEFVNSQYLSATLEHNFMGFFLNKIPGIRKLKLREVVGIKALWGTLGANDVSLLRVPHDVYSAERPYAEASVGLDNILKVLRFDVVFRLTHHDHPQIEKVGLRAKLHVVF